MSKRLRMMIAAVALAGWSCEAMAAILVNVQSEKAVVRASPGPFAAALATVTYGAQVTELATQGAWTQVKTASGVTGWTQTSSLTSKTIKLKAGSSDVNKVASGEELALAGKGFNSQVEGEFKAKNPTMDFRWIDRMETFRITEPMMVRFLEQGGLTVVGKGDGK